MSLLIRQTEAVHDEIEAMLRLLREKRRRLPQLLKAAGGPSLEEVHEAEASDRQAERELAKIEDSLRKLEGIDPEKLPQNMRGMGGGFFDVPGDGGDVPAFDPDPLFGGEMQFGLCGGVGLMAGGNRDDLAGRSRRLAFRAMRIALRFEGALPAKNGPGDGEAADDEGDVPDSEPGAAEAPAEE